MNLVWLELSLATAAKEVLIIYKVFYWNGKAMQKFLLGLGRFTILTDFTTQNPYDGRRYVVRRCTRVAVKLSYYFWLWL